MLRHPLTTLRLAFSDLWHERVLTACLLLSVGAILGPLLLLFGLKNGVVETMRNRLLSDPNSRQIFPQDKQLNYPYSREWFTRMQERPDVEFIVPRLDTSNDTTVFLSLSDNPPANDILDNAICYIGEKDDPRLKKFDREAPGNDEAVLTHSLAQELGVQEGTVLYVHVDRGGFVNTREVVSAKVRVRAILPPDVTLTKQVWFPLSFMIGVRDFRNGLPVPELGWPGKLEEIEPVFDSVLTLLNTVPGKRELTELANKPPRLVDTKEIPPEDLLILTGLVPNPAIDPIPTAILWRGRGSQIRPQNIDELQSRLNELGIGPIILPLIDPISAEITAAHESSESRQTYNLFALDESRTSRNSSGKDLEGIRQSFISTWNSRLFPMAGHKSADSATGSKWPDKIDSTFLPLKFVDFLARWPEHTPLLEVASRPVSRSGEGIAQPTSEPFHETVGVSIEADLSAEEAILSVEGLIGVLEIPVVIEKRKGVPQGTVVVSADLGGMLRKAQNEPILYSAELGQFRKESPEFNDFRLFAANLEDVVPLVKEFEDKGIAMRHRADEISKILELDHNLTRLFWLIASASAGAGFFGLVASLFASVERKRRDLGVLQLLGMPKGCLFAFPVIQSAALSIGAFALAFGLFWIFADVINQQFASEFREGETFCSLKDEHALIVAGATFSFGLLASLLAAIRSCRIQPSEALRSE